MAFNRFMHPRNIYKNKADFKALALEFPEFRKYANQELSGEITIDFKNPDALRALTSTLLKKDFNLDVEFPPNRLIPTVPLRLNYILWLEDIFENNREGLCGIDIGTGASCIFPLMCAKKNNWNFLAIELDPESFACAERNVINNELLDKIKVVLGQDETIILNHINPEDAYHFCMCNPPFFHNELDGELLEGTSNSACSLEKVTKGGEVEFLKKIIKESSELKSKITVYTTMLGRKKSLKLLKEELEKLQVNFITTEFYQGRTMRWGLAWTWDTSFKLLNTPHMVTKPKPPLTFVLPKSDDSKLYKIGIFLHKIRLLLKELLCEWEEVQLDQNYAKLVVKAKQNTWSKQRRKRRQLLREQKEADSSEPIAKQVKLDDETDPSTIDQDKIKNFQQQIANVLIDVKAAAINQNKGEIIEIYILQFTLVLKHPVEGIVMELKYIDGLGFDLLHQVMQYFKNKLKI